jgi:hypothetical protein
VFWDVRRVFGVLVFFFGLAVGFAIGFPVGLLNRSVDPIWFEAVGTWVGALATVVAVILGAGLVFFSEEFTRRRERIRQEDTERNRLQLAADHVFCDIRLAGTYLSVGPRTVAVDRLEIEVDNRSGSVVTDVVCELHLVAFEWSNVISEPIDTGSIVRREFPPLGPLEARQDGRDLRANAYFTFSLDGHHWSRRYGQPAVRLDPSDRAPGSVDSRSFSHG